MATHQIQLILTRNKVIRQVWLAEHKAPQHEWEGGKAVKDLVDKVWTTLIEEEIWILSPETDDLSAEIIELVSIDDATSICQMY